MGCCASAGCLPVREEDGGKLGELGVEDLLVRGVALLHHLPQLLGTSAEPGELLDQPVHVEGVNGLREPGKPELRHQDVMLRGVTDRYGRLGQLERGHQVVITDRDHAAARRHLPHDVSEGNRGLGDDLGRIETGPRFPQVGQDLLHHPVVRAVRVPYEQPDLSAAFDQPADELLHRDDIGGVNIFGVAALIIGTSVLHHADTHQIRGARLIRRAG